MGGYLERKGKNVAVGLNRAGQVRAAGQGWGKGATWCKRERKEAGRAGVGRVSRTWQPGLMSWALQLPEALLETGKDTDSR